MPGTPVRIYLARHGETLWNVEGRWQGQSDSPLTERGVEQSRQLAEALRQHDLAAIYTSDLERAHRTARMAVEAHGDVPLLVDRRLREIHTGDWTGRMGADLRREHPEAMETWSERPWAHHMPGGESLADVHARCLAFLADVMPRHQGQAVAVITHGVTAQTLLVHAMGGTVRDLWLKERVDNCQLSRLEWTAERGLRLLELSDVRHLAGVGTLRGWRTVDHDDPAA